MEMAVEVEVEMEVGVVKKLLMLQLRHSGKNAFGDNKPAKICVYFVIFEIFVAWQIFSLAPAFPHSQ